MGATLSFIGDAYGRDDRMTQAADRVALGPLSEAGRHFLVRRDIAFLNHGSYGARPRPVLETYQRWQRRLESQPVEFLGRRLPGLLAAARARLAAFVGAAPSDLVFVPNATHGMNVIARSLELQPGDEVLGTTHEYGAVERIWRFTCEERGARYRSQPVSLPVTSVNALLDELWEAVTERTRVLVVSHITSPTALIFPIAEICRRAAEAGIVTAIDGAHAPGQLALDLSQIGADFYVGNCHKWLSAPVGSGFLCARADRQQMLKPLVVSWGWQARTPGRSPFQDYFEWLGTDDPAAFLSVHTAIAFQERYDWAEVRAACHQLAAEARERIGALTGLPHICPDARDWWGQMCSVPIPIADKEVAGTLKRRLWEEHAVEVPIVEWQDRFFVRVSIQAYNSERDIDRLLAGLAHLL